MKMKLEIDTDNESTILKSFEEIATELINQYCISVESKKYRILELEFYFYHEEKFRDCFTYRKEEQKTNGEWYFHYSGIDITFGSKHSWGGILLRSIGEMDDNNKITNVICGPLKLKNVLLNNFHSIFQDSITFKLEKIILPTKDLFKSSRIGLTLKGKDHIEQASEFLEKSFKK